MPLLPVNNGVGTSIGEKSVRTIGQSNFPKDITVIIPKSERSHHSGRFNSPRRLLKQSLSPDPVRWKNKRSHRKSNVVKTSPVVIPTFQSDVSWIGRTGENRRITAAIIKRERGGKGSRKTCGNPDGDRSVGTGGKIEIDRRCGY